RLQEFKLTEMSILFGHPTGNPNSHQAALAHFESSRLEAFCVPWFPSEAVLACLRSFPLTHTMATRLERRRFEPLAEAPKIQSRIGEIKRRSEEHTSELQSPYDLVCRLLLEKKNKI